MNADPYTEELIEECQPEGSVEVGEVRLNGRGGPGRPKKPRPDYVPRAKRGPGLFNRNELPEDIRNNYASEKWEHQVIGYLKAQGHSNMEVAEITGYCPIAVGQIVRLPWVMDLIAEEIRKRGGDAVQAVLSGAILDTVQFLIDVRDNEKAGLRERLSSAKQLLDRALGAATQSIVHIDGSKQLENLSDDELAKIVLEGRQRN